MLTRTTTIVALPLFLTAALSFALSGNSSAVAASDPAAPAKPPTAVATASGESGNQPGADLTAKGADEGEGGIAGGTPCQISCTPPLILENEPCGANTVDCGCDCTPSNFLTLRCPEGYCANVWAINGSYDTDWYRAIVNDPNGDGQSFPCFTLTSEFPAVIEIYVGNCGGLTMVNQAETSNCTSITVCACVPAPGTCKVKIYPGTIAGGPTLNGLFCPDTDRDYTIKYTCNDVCSATTGACCYIGSDGVPTCSIITQQQCTALNGTYQGNGTSCTPDPCASGACCYQIPGTTTFQCVITTPQDCHNTFNGIYQGNGTSCTPDPCNVTGACCYFDPTGPQCTVTTPADCSNLPGGTYFGNGTTCNPNPCIQGACCYLNPAVPGVQCVVTSAQDCHNIYNGIYQGNGTTCNPNPCAATGACCYIGADGVVTCTITTQTDCEQNLGGVYQGDNTICTSDTCLPQTGACCYQIAGTTNFTCIITTQQDCLTNYFNATYYGNGSICTQTLCEPPAMGRCCYHAPPPANNFLCVVTTPQDCAAIYGGIYGGNGTSCSPGDPCNPPPPTGACCFKDGPAVGYVCVITTQQNCTDNYPNGVYLGNGTSCVPNPCPNTGACCYQIPGTIIFTCGIFTPQECQAINGTYLGNNVPCSSSTCGPCYPPPPNMVGWWTFDETGGSIANESVANNDGNYKPNSSTGPTPGPGQVQNSLFFDGVNDYVEVPANSTLNIGVSDFSVDAWIKWTPNPNLINPEICTANGFRFRLVTGGSGPAGLLLWLTGGSGHKCVKFGIVPPNQWVHVAATYQQPSGGLSNNGVCKLYVNGSLIFTSSNGPFNNFSTNGYVRIGEDLSGSPGNLFNGNIDELEIFNRALSQPEIQNIISQGKCKQHCGGQWESPFCANTNTLTATVQVCNDSGVTQSYFVSFAGIPGIPNTLCNGPLLTGFTVIGPNPVTVGPGQCLPVQVQIARPAGLSPGMHSCYTMTITNTQNGQVSQCTGSVIRTNKWCWHFPDCCILSEVLVGVPTQAIFKVDNTDDPDGTFQYTIQVTGPDMMPDTQNVRLNGLPPGTRYIGNLSLAPGGSAEVPVQIEFLHHVPFVFFDVLISGDEDNNGENSDVVISAGIHSGPRPFCPADIAPSGGNHVVNVDDLLAVINSWGPCPAPPANCPADIAPSGGDGTVNVDDLLAVINSWGACP